ncbi:transposase [Streptomyces sp. NRRL F-2664]|uniref:transposase n=1 Tax=Streptomyces sp. NRRL F-2664 TaxID=1463842 RepID=UPI00068BADBE|nr:transposase [Streptomyces sp. NRRL F-2664]
MATRPAAEADVDTTDRVHDVLDERGLLPGEHYADSAYITAEKVIKAHAPGVELNRPGQPGQSVAEPHRGCFRHRRLHDRLGHAVRHLPAGPSQHLVRNRLDRHGSPRVQFTFSLTNCTPCPVRSRCTHAKTAARTVTLRPCDQHELLQRLYAEQATEQWHRHCGHRAGVEGTISQGIRAFGLRRSRYRGQAKTAVQHILTATAINLTRLDAWTSGTPLGLTRVSHIAALAPQAATT